MSTAAPLVAMDGEHVEEKQLKKPKKKKLTPAEKLERKLKQEREFKMLEMRDRLQREYELSKKTEQKYRERWEDMCREVKLKQMKQELVDWEAQVNRIIKQKDEKIQLLLDEIATTEDFRQKSFSTNLQMMDYLTDTLKTFQETSYLLYEKEASEVLHDFYQEVEEGNTVANNIKLNCESVAHATGLLTEKELRDDYKIFLDKRDDGVNNEIDKRYRLRDNIIKKMKILQDQLLEFLNSLMNITLDAQKYEKINSLMDRQQNFQTESLRLKKAEERSTQTHADLRKDLFQEEKDSKRKLDDLQLQHAFFIGIRSKTEQEMKLNREQTHEKLKIVTSESFAVIKKYQKLQKFGELLLSLAASCRKLQTESEKVLPWGDFQEPRCDTENADQAFKLDIIDLKNHVDISEKELQNNSQLMSNFWRRQSIAEAQTLLLEEKRKILLTENQTYIDAIKRLSKTDNTQNLKETLQIKQVGKITN